MSDSKEMPDSVCRAEAVSLQEKKRDKKGGKGIERVCLLITKIN